MPRFLVGFDAGRNVRTTCAQQYLFNPWGSSCFRGLKLAPPRTRPQASPSLVAWRLFTCRGGSHASVRLMVGSSSTHPLFLVANQVYSHPSRYVNFFDGENLARRKGKLYAWTRKMREKGEWADQLFINAVARAHEVFTTPADGCGEDARKYRTSPLGVVYRILLHVVFGVGCERCVVVHLRRDPQRKSFNCLRRCFF